MKQNKRKIRESSVFFSSLLLFLLFFLSFLSSVQNTFAAEQCSGVTDADGECYDSYDAYFQADPKAAAIQYPDKYMTFIKENPSAVTSNPDAYEAVISGNVAYLNQNKGAFQTFAETKGVEFFEVEATFGSYDAVSGKMVTITEDGTTAVTSIDFKALKVLGKNSDIGFNDDGQLVYSSENDKFLVNGDVQTGTTGGVTVKRGNIYLAQAKQSLEIAGENSATIGIKSGFTEVVFIDAKEPMRIQYDVKEASGEYKSGVGTLVHGKLTLENMEHGLVTIESNTEFITSYGTKIQIHEDRLFISNSREVCKNVHCILETKESLYLNTNDINSLLKIETKDESEKKIIVEHFLPAANGKLDITLQKQDGTAVLLEFSTDPPTIQGNINLLGTKITHTFTYESQLYPWVLSHGDTASFTGTTNANPLIELVKEGKIQPTEMSDLVESMNKNDFRKMIGGFDDPNIQYQLIETYRKTTNNQQVMTREETSFIRSIPEEARIELMKKLLEDTLSFEDELTMSDVLNAIQKSPELQRQIIGKVESFNTLVTLDTVKDKDLQLEIVKKMDFNSGEFLAGESTKGISIRRVLEKFSDDPEAFQTVLQEMPDNEEFDFYPQNIAEIYADPTFQEQTKDMDFANQYSVAMTTDRLVRRSGKEQNAATRGEALTEIMKQRDAFENYHILDEETYYIPITHEEDQFQNDDMIQIARESGVTNIANQELKGSTDIEKTKSVKAEFLTYVKESDEKGKTTIHFNNHGGPNNQFLSSGQAGSAKSDDLHRQDAISYVELGDSLLERGNLGEVTIIIDSCYSNDFKNNLYSYLGEKRSTTLPIIITETNRGQVGWSDESKSGSKFGNAIYYVHTPGKPLTGADIFKVESETFTRQDLSVTIPATDSSTLQWTDTTVGPVIDLGSINDAGVSLPPTKLDTTGGVEETTSQPTPTNVLEIAANEQAAEEAIGFA